MKATTENLDLIDRYLEQRKLDFLDFKLEIKDHIASQTEDLCEKQNTSFEDALPKVLKKWEPSLLLKSSIWISNKRSFSSIVLDGIKKRYMIYNSITLPIIIGLLILQFHFMNEFKSESLRNLLLAISIILLIILSVLRYSISRINYQTSFSYEFKRIYKMAIMFLCFDIMYFHVLGITPIVIFKAMVITYFPIAIYSFFKHKQFQNRVINL
ncbi:hypothetical protein GV828_11390 [Flavobacterium sp. NST-5]|uniref:Uncharacterized protein n=1 Tax=Flavobacterium ichthyis TaxID=2698827 RepID=A0ABW9ZB54_9FLAO|nr:hypothetical protein [Flavobacterium ichthyis]NBL65804.1 hypothetical protein [Flavobacterium ichthyis]